jgi:hypothetical protein
MASPRRLIIEEFRPVGQIGIHGQRVAPTAIEKFLRGRHTDPYIFVLNAAHQHFDRLIRVPARLGGDAPLRSRRIVRCLFGWRVLTLWNLSIGQQQFTVTDLRLPSVPVALQDLSHRHRHRSQIHPSASLSCTTSSFTPRAFSHT